MDSKAVQATGEIQVVEFSREMLEQATEVLVEAFKTEETTAYHLDTDRPSTLRGISILDGIILQLYHDAGRPLFAAIRDGSIVGMAVVRDPRLPISKRNTISMFLPRLPRLAALFARRPIRVLRIMVAARHPKGLTESYFTFEALGILPEHQGSGAGGALMQRVQRFVQEDPTLSGIYLNTGSEKNEAFYERRGYLTLKVVDLGGAKVYHMFWQNPAFG